MSDRVNERADALTPQQQPLSMLHGQETPALAVSDSPATSIVPAAADAAPAGADSPAIQPPGDASLGRCLRAAREQRGLSISDVAQTIKFSPRQIEAVEADDYAHLSGNTFLRGMIRSYAKLLHLDVEPLLAQLEPYAPQVRSVMPVPPDTGMAMPQAGGVNRYAAYLKPATLALAVAALAGSYFYLAAQRNAAPVAVTSEQPVAADAVQATQPIAVMPPQAKIDPALPVAAPALADAVGGAPTAPAVPGPETKQLIFTFEGKSWVEVKDASKQVIFAQNNPAGSRQVVSGKPPFDLVIGSAGHVRLQYDERQVDLLPHTRVDVARLVLE